MRKNEVIRMDGRRFGRWLVVERDGVLYERRAAWSCVCDCGVKRTVDGVSLRVGYSTSCGCRSVDVAKARVGAQHQHWKGGTRWAAILRRYGITRLKYEAILAAQGGVCAICRKAEIHTHAKTGDVNPLSVDHDHATGEVRGLLCHGCNLGVGNFRNNPSAMRAAAAYIEGVMMAKAVSR